MEKRTIHRIRGSIDKIPSILSATSPSLAQLKKKKRKKKGRKKKKEKGKSERPENFAENPIDKQTETKSGGGSLKSKNVANVGGAYFRGGDEGRDRAPIGRRSDVLIQMQRTRTTFLRSKEYTCTPLESFQSA